MSPIVYIVEELERYAVDARLRTGRRVRALRERAGHTAHDLGLRAGMPADSVARVEGGEVELGLAELSRLARALRVPMSALVADETSP